MGMILAEAAAASSFISAATAMNLMPMDKRAMASPLIPAHISMSSVSVFSWAFHGVWSRSAWDFHATGLAASILLGSWSGSQYMLLALVSVATFPGAGNGGCGATGAGADDAACW